jgi:hypothetical protein
MLQCSRIQPAMLQHGRLGRFLFPVLMASAVLFSLASVSPAQMPDRVAAYKEKYERETDPVRKARALGNYGDWQVGEFVRQANANEFDAAFATLSDFRNEVRTTFEALKARGVNAERKPDGFKELEIHLDKTLWKLDRAVALVPYTARPAFQDIRDDLDRIHTELIRMLFPRGAGGSH